MRRLCLASALMIAAIVQPVTAQTMQCAPRDRVLAQLATQAQTRHAIGLAGQAVMEMFADPDSMNWTITVTLPDGRMCLLARGTAFDGRDEGFPVQGVQS